MNMSKESQRFHFISLGNLQVAVNSNLLLTVND